MQVYNWNSCLNFVCSYLLAIKHITRIAVNDHQVCWHFGMLNKKIWNDLGEI